MHNGRTTLSKFLIQQLKGSAELSDLAALLVDIAAAVKAISAMTAKGELGGVLGSLDTQNVQGETQKNSTSCLTPPSSTPLRLAAWWPASPPKKWTIR